MGWEVKTNMGGQTEHVQCQNRKIFTWKDLRDEICGEAFSKGMKLKDTGIINVTRKSHGLNICSNISIFKMATVTQMLIFPLFLNILKKQRYQYVCQLYFFIPVSVAFINYRKTFCKKQFKIVTHFHTNNLILMNMCICVKHVQSINAVSSIFS